MNPHDSDARHFTQQLDPGRGVLVGDSWEQGANGTFAVTNPADRSVLAEVADGDGAQASRAVDAAEAATLGWLSTSPRRRADALMAVYAALHRDMPHLAALVVAENGKTTRDAEDEIRYAATFFRWYAEECVRSHGDYAPAPAGGSRTLVTRRPVGIAALVTPWNFPAAMIARKIAPALAAGCTVLVKPAAETPLTALAIARLALDAGVPPGVVNVVPTSRPSDVVDAWLRDERVRKLSFTGSTVVGRALLAKAAQRVVNTSMELGGNAPFIVFDDADIAAAIDGAMIAKFRCGGQACTAANRFFVHDAVADEFTERLGEKITSLVVGRGSESGTDIGPLIDDHAVRRVSGLVDDALADGAKRVAQAPLPSPVAGHFLSPVLLDHVAPHSRVMKEEVFGPVAPVMRWTDVDDMLAHANDTHLGLAAYVYSRDLRRAQWAAERIDAGMVAVNRAMLSDAAAPFGGTKQSGLGREGARHGLAEYQELQYLSIDWPLDG